MARKNKTLYPPLYANLVRQIKRLLNPGKESMESVWKGEAGDGVELSVHGIRADKSYLFRLV